LEPVIASLDTSHPLLERQELTSIFSNFIDIWNLHSSFFESLSTIMQTSKSSPPPLSPLLLAHFPYLSLYNPFVTAFPTAMASLGRLQTSKPAFATFIAKQEADERCGKLKLRDWLLTVVQRCPRYLLLLKDLIGCTEVDDPEHASLSAVHSLVSKSKSLLRHHVLNLIFSLVTNSLNTSLHTHAQTLALLALQRNTAQLPFQLISPGRNLVKRGTLLQLEGAADPKEREFLLFTDCIIWLAGADGQDGQLEEKWDWQTREPSSSFLAVRPGITRKRSKSDAELPTLRTTREIAQAGRISEGGEAHSSSVLPKSKSAFPRIKKKKRSATSGAEEKWIYKGRAELVDVEVVPSLHGDLGGERRLEILSPEASFAAYASMYAFCELFSR
jgi:FYVE/RhoGEF/PH domain-containing protein 5/6